MLGAQDKRSWRWMGRDAQLIFVCFAMATLVAIAVVGKPCQKCLGYTHLSPNGGEGINAGTMPWHKYHFLTATDRKWRMVLVCRAQESPPG